MSQRAQRVSKLPEDTFLFICTDGPDTAPLRTQHLEGHLDHIERYNSHYRVAGPMRKDANGAIVGSFFLIAAATEADAWDMMRGDPYIRSDMYASITVHHIVPACGEWMGGVIWDKDEVMANVARHV